MAKALIVDLNNFARYPTLAIGYLVASLRGAGTEVDVLSPLSYGVPAVEREGRESAWDHLQRRVYFSSHPLSVGAHDLIRNSRSRWRSRPNPVVVEETRRKLDRSRPDVLLLSAYLDQYPSVVALARIAARRKVPVLLGGPMFNVGEVAREWVGIPGLSAVVGAEVDLVLPDLVDAVVAGADLGCFSGVYLPDGRFGGTARPLESLDRLPIPDLTDVPWDRYPTRVIPVMTGRGCSWGLCTFCSDVRTANGRTFRSRPLDAVLDEIEQQAERHRSKDVIFLDIKLNSSLPIWRGIIAGFQERLPGGRWIGTVHVEGSGENGLSREELRSAHDSGMTRTTFGLETGSQSLNNAMAKGTRLERTSAFLHDAHAAGISVRTTLMLGYPGETADDIDRTVRYLEEHEHCLDRVRLSRFKVIPATRFHDRYARSPERFSSITNFKWDFRQARAHYRYRPSTQRTYRRSKLHLLDVVHRINRKQLRDEADVFDGLM